MFDCLLLFGMLTIYQTYTRVTVVLVLQNSKYVLSRLLHQHLLFILLVFYILYKSYLGSSCKGLSLSEDISQLSVEDNVSVIVIILNNKVWSQQHFFIRTLNWFEGITDASVFENYTNTCLSTHAILCCSLFVKKIYKNIRIAQRLFWLPLSLTGLTLENWWKL